MDNIIRVLYCPWLHYCAFFSLQKNNTEVYKRDVTCKGYCIQTTPSPLVHIGMGRVRYFCSCSAHPLVDSQLAYQGTMAVFGTPLAQYVENFVKEAEDDMLAPAQSRFQESMPKIKKNVMAMEEVCAR